jgi:hypothetical protein
MVKRISREYLDKWIPVNREREYSKHKAEKPDKEDSND